jgi:FkbM family methyltransferase
MLFASLPHGGESCEIRPPGLPPIRLAGVPAKDPTVFARLCRGDLVEPRLLAALGALTTPRASVFDVGAQIGWFTLCLRHLTGTGGKVIAIEPEATNLKLLHHNISINHGTSVRVIAAAAGASIGRENLRVSTSDAAGHRIAGVRDAANTIRIPTVTLDSLAHYSRSAPLVVKIDTGGAETAVLCGAAQLLSRHPARAIIAFSPAALIDCGSTPAALLEQITRHFDRLWLLSRNQPPRAVTPDALSQQAATDLASDADNAMHIVALRSEDTEAVAAIERTAAAG